MANKLFRELLKNVAPETKSFVELSVNIANSIVDILKNKKITQKEFARMMDKDESEISKWLCGTHNFTLKTISKIESVLNEKIIFANTTNNQFTKSFWNSLSQYVFDLHGRIQFEPNLSFTLNDVTSGIELQLNSNHNNNSNKDSQFIFENKFEKNFHKDIEANSYMSIVDLNSYKKTG